MLQDHAWAPLLALGWVEATEQAKIRILTTHQTAFLMYTHCHTGNSKAEITCALYVRSRFSHAFCMRMPTSFYLVLQPYQAQYLMETDMMNFSFAYHSPSICYFPSFRPKYAQSHYKHVGREKYSQYGICCYHGGVGNDDVFLLCLDAL